MHDKDENSWGKSKARFDVAFGVQSDGIDYVRDIDAFFDAIRIPFGMFNMEKYEKQCSSMKKAVWMPQ